MLRALTTAATGMIAQQNYLDVIANNVANVNTTGFKKSRIEFQDLLSQASRTPGALMNQGTYQPVGIEIGLGVKTAATTRVFTQGVAISTGRQLDIEIEGEGFLQVMKEDGSFKYRRLSNDSYKDGIITDIAQMGGYPEYKGTPYIDTDGDGMPDEWEIANGLNPNDPSDANGDCNGDGYTNIEKFINGIDTKVKVDWTNMQNNHDTLAGKTKLF